MDPDKVTDAQGRQLLRIERNQAIPMRARAGGAVFRLLDRMVEAKWIKGPPPYELTEAGMAALKRFHHRETERQGRFMRRGGRR
jgi:hypothetical protein